MQNDKDIDVAHFIGYHYEGNYHFVEIDDVSFFSKKVRDHYNKIIQRLPHNLFKSKIIDIYDKEDGRVFNKNYVVDSEIVDKVTTLIIDVVTEYGQDTDKNDNGTIDLSTLVVNETCSDYGVSLKLRFFVLNFREYGLITNEIESIISKKVRNTETLSLETHIKGELKISKK